MPVAEVADLFRQCKSAAGCNDEAAAVLTLVCVLQARPPEADGLLTVSQVADKLGVSERTVRNLADCGKLQPSRIGKGRGTLRFAPADLDAYRRESSGNPLPLRRFG